MDGIPRDDLERLMFFETTREQAAADYLRSPHDPDNLTKWGGALLELAHFRQGQESVDMIQDAISKLEEALKINPRKHDTLWCLGNALTSQGFVIPEADKANEFFRKAEVYFQQALGEEPGNELYQRSLDMSQKAPILHMEIQKQLGSAALSSPGPSTSANNNRGKKKKNKNSELKYDILGWVILAAGIVAWVGMAKSALPPPPPSPSNL